MGILFHCTSCDRPLNVGNQVAGQTGICPNCRSTIQVPKASEIADINFRFLLEAWTKRQEPEDRGGRAELNSVSIDITTTADVTMAAIPSKNAAPGSDAGNRIGIEVKSKKRSEKRGTTKSPPVVTLKPINVGGVLTESEKVAGGVSERVAEKFSASAPDLLGDTGSAVWFIRPPSGGQFGPASAKLLRQWIGEERVTGDSYVWCEGWDNWQIAADVFPAIASKVSVESMEVANADAVTATRTRTAYMKARKRRTMRSVIGLVLGTAILVGLIVALVLIVKGSSG